MDIKDCKSGMEVYYFRPRSGSSSSAIKYTALIERVTRQRVLVRPYDAWGKLMDKAHHTSPDLLEQIPVARSG